MNDLVERLRDPKKEGACWCCQEAADEIERLSSEGKIMREAFEYIRENGPHGDECEEIAARVLASVSEEQCQHEWYAPYCGRFSHLTLVCKLCGATE